MRKTVIKTGSCFLEKAVWYMSSLELKPHWFFYTALGSSGISSDCFIVERHTSVHSVDGEIAFKETIVTSCVNCCKFQVTLPVEPIISELNKLNCRFVSYDMNVFSDDFDSYVFVGNAQFVVGRYFLGEKCDEKIEFRKRPLHKSCFTSLKKLCYKYLCTNCKKFYYNFIEKDLHILFRIDNELSFFF